MAQDKGIHDIAVDIMKERLNEARDILKERYKGIRPFRKPKVLDRELYYNYAKLSEVEKLIYGYYFGNVWSLYEQRMQELGRKYA